MNDREKQDSAQDTFVGAIVIGLVLSLVALLFSPVAPTSWLRDNHPGWLYVVWLVVFPLTWLGLIASAVTSAGRKGWWLLAFAPFMLHVFLSYVLIYTVCYTIGCPV